VVLEKTLYKCSQKYHLESINEKEPDIVVFGEY